MLKVCCIITGASQGFGRCIAELLVQNGKLSPKPVDHLRMILCARSVNGLEETREIALSKKDICDVVLDVVPVDLSQPAEVKKMTAELFSGLSQSYNKVYFFNNAGTLGNIKNEIFDFKLKDIEEAFNINVMFSIFFIAGFCKHFSDCENTSIFVVQTSSLAAIQPLKFLSLYCSSKAAMDMFLKTLSLDYPSIRTLNYAPGPMDTAMGKKIMNDSRDEETKKSFENLFKTGNIVDPLVSANKMITLLREDKYESGAHIDYYDC